VATGVFRGVTAQGSAFSTLDLLNRWQRFWFAEIPPYQFAHLRIVFGLLGVIGLLGLTPVSTYWAPTGLVPLSGSMAELKTALVNWNLGAAAGLILFVALVVFFVGMTVGYQTRAAVGACFLGSVIQYHWNTLPLSAGNQVVIAMLFCLVWADCGAVWSVDAWLQARRARPGSASISTAAYPVWPLRLIRIQIAIIYLSSGLRKLFFSPVWRDGSALHFVLQQNVFSRLPIWFSPALDPLLTAMTYFVLFWELGFAVMLLHPWTRRLALITGVALHIGMWVSLEIGLFSWIMIASYLAFLEPAKARSFWGRLT
jgi:HTTM domain